MSDMSLPTRRDARRFIRWANRELRNRESSSRVILAVTRKEDGGCVGMVGIGPKAELDGEIELGYYIADEHQGRGYATEAARAMADWAFAHMPLPYLVAIVRHDNPASSRVLEKLGFAHAGKRNVEGCGAMNYYQLERPGAFQKAKDWFSGAPALAEMGGQVRLKQWEAEAAASFPAGARILDIGCGTGREAFALHAMGFYVTGIDISEAAIEAARGTAAAQGIGIDFLVTDGESLPFEDDAFDVIVMWAQTFGLFHGEEKQRDILAQCGRVLKPGGLLSFSAHDREYQQAHCAQYLKGRRFYPFAETDLYYESFTLDELRGAAEQAGFRVLGCKRGLVYSEEDGTILLPVRKGVTPCSIP